MTFESQYRFANISVTKARIFMKFESYIHKIVKNCLLIFCKDPCTHGRTRGKNMRAHVSSRQNARVHIYASSVRVCARIVTIILLIIFYYLMNISLKFYKDPSFRLQNGTDFQKSSNFNVFFIFLQLHPSEVFKDG